MCYALGDVVRVSPNELSFASARSYEDIYGFPKGGRQHFIKGDFYEIYGSAYKTGCIGSERDPATHARKKKNLAPAFTTRALSAQEHIVQQYMDVFIRKIEPLSLDSPKGLNLTKWFEMLTFDILGEMAFGESFGCLAEGRRSYTAHRVLASSERLVIAPVNMQLIQRQRSTTFGLTLSWNIYTRSRWWTTCVASGCSVYWASLSYPLSSCQSGVSTQAIALTRSRGTIYHGAEEPNPHTLTSFCGRRLESSSDRGDFFTNLVDKVKAGDADLEEMTAHASTLM